MKRSAKYLEIENDIKLDIASRKLKKDEQIMTEEQLCERYGVSRMTVNKAISNLVGEGYVYRVPGRGSFVRSPHVAKPVSAARSFTEDMLAMGLRPSAKLIEYCVRRGAEVPEAAERLRLSDSDLMHCFVRLRSGDDLPICVSYTYISAACVPAIDIGCLEGSLYEYLRGLGFEIGGKSGEFTAVLPTEEQKKILGIKDEALLLHSHVTYLKDGRIMEFIKTYYVGSRYSYTYRPEDL